MFIKKKSTSLLFVLKKSVLLQKHIHENPWGENIFKIILAQVHIYTQGRKQC